jgi:hypothetical protein
MSGLSLGTVKSDSFMMPLGSFREGATVAGGARPRHTASLLKNFRLSVSQVNRSHRERFELSVSTDGIAEPEPNEAGGVGVAPYFAGYPFARTLETYSRVPDGSLARGKNYTFLFPSSVLVAA